MPSKGRKHFDTYTRQNRVKHSILTKYFGAYLQALADKVDAFHYLDGFAGSGTYGAENPGSPLYAIELLVRFPNRGAVSLVESNARSFEQLQAAIASAPGVEKLLDAPWLRCGAFSECLNDALARPLLARIHRLATFAFVDPCGVAGVYMGDLARILRLPYAECLLFLNYDGLTRWLGGVRAGTHAREHIERFFGDVGATNEALVCLDMAATSREGRLLGVYVDALRQHSGAAFVLPFRFKALDRNRTSHYLIHLSQHALGFKIMKEVMRREASESDYGTFGLIPEDELVGQRLLFRPNADQARAEILDALSEGPQAVRLFVEQWPLRPTDMLVAKEYRELLIGLEAEKRIEVFDGKTGQPAPAETRPKRRGKTTLGERYELRLRRHASTV